MKRILIVDDEELVARTLGRVLSRCGHDVVLANSAEQALEQAKGGFFNLLITDMKLPGMNGVDLIKRFKELTPQTRVIAITGFPDLEQAQIVLSLGVLEYLNKPFEIADLELMVQRCLEADQHAAAFAGKMVLAVEDDPAFALFLSRLFDLRGIPCKVLGDAAAALAYFEAGGKADLVLADIGLPGSSGLELCRQLKSIKGNGIPVALMTATFALDPSMESQAQEAGADFYTPKPNDPYELGAYVEKILLRRP